MGVQRQFFHGPLGGTRRSFGRSDILNRLTPNGRTRQPTSGRFRPCSTLCAAATLLSFVTISFGQVTFSQFAIPSAAGTGPYAITAGREANLWFVEQSGVMVGRTTTAGVITQFALPTASASFGITPGPDGNLWFTEGVGKIGRITPVGAITEFTIPGSFSSPRRPEGPPAATIAATRKRKN